MLSYMLRRFVGIVVMLLLLSLFTFVLSRTVPGGPWSAFAQVPLTDVQLQQFKAKYGLDKPILEQYVVWLGQAIRLDFGVPFTAPEMTVTGLILTLLPYSAIVGFLACILALALGIALGMVAAVKQNGWIDNAIVTYAVVVGSIPSFVLGFVVVYVFAAKLRWFPAGGWGGPESLVLPVFAYGFPASAGVARWTRQCMVDAISSDYVRTAYAKGLRTPSVMSRHVLRNALIPMVTSFLPMFPGMMTGSMFIESVFGLPGLGKQFVLSSTNRDYPMVLGITIFWALLISLTYFLTDILYGVIDPRVRIMEKAR
ncbi:MAG: ABC transporter permease [Chloroflexi bacterium]|jgi:ABC-type dipeptide/oligopeptide/nickel transport system permease component|nr:ABC transporter permease [Chloroflexota bacterium]